MKHTYIPTHCTKQLRNGLAAILILLVSCQKDETVVEPQDINTTEDTSSTENPVANEETSEESSYPTTGEIIFEQGFTLDKERTFINYILPEATYNQFLAGEGDLAMVSQKAYTYLQDDFDFIVILSNEAVQPAGLFYGRATPVNNQIQGLGMNQYDYSADYGSLGNLKTIIYMPRTTYISNGPFLHELAHNWANKGFLPSTVSGHWGYASTAGQLGGFDSLEDLGNGRYRGSLLGNSGFGTFANGGNSIAYGDLELYTMGFLDPADVAPIQVAVNPTSTEIRGEFTADEIATYTIQDLINEHGARIPSATNSQKDFKALTVVISKQELSEEDATNVTNRLENFARQGAPDASWGSLKNFWQATKEKGTLSFSVSQESLK